MSQGHIPNKLIECPEPGILFTHDNALWAYYALKAARNAGQSIPEQDELCDELAGILFPRSTPKDRESGLSTAEWFAASKELGCTGVSFDPGNDTISHAGAPTCPVNPGA